MNNNIISSTAEPTVEETLWKSKPLPRLDNVAVIVSETQLRERHVRIYEGGKMTVLETSMSEFSLIIDGKELRVLLTPKPLPATNVDADFLRRLAATS